jgi:hypothetical protein
VVKNIIVLCLLSFYAFLNSKPWKPDAEIDHLVRASYIQIPTYDDHFHSHYEDSGVQYGFHNFSDQLFEGVPRNIAISSYNPNVYDVNKTQNINIITGAIYPDTLDEQNYFSKESDYFMTKN